MISIHRVADVMCWATLLCLPGAAWAQSPGVPLTVPPATVAHVTGEAFIWNGKARAWVFGTRNPVSLKVGQKVILAEEAGTRKGEIVDIAPDRVVAMVDGRRREIPAAAIARIAKSDTLRNGALIGLLVGGGFAASRLSNCEINCYPQYIPLLAGIGAGVGTLADALKRTPTIYLIP